MIKESNLIELPIINENNEHLIYSIKNVIYCLRSFHIIGFCLNELNSDKATKVLLYKKIKSITDKGILIQSWNDIEEIDDVPEIRESLNNYKPVIGYEIYLNNDEIIGVVKDTLVQISSGRILGFIMSEGIFEDLINGYSFLPLVEGINFHEYKIIITNHEQVEILPQVGGLKKMLGIDKPN